MPIKPFVVLQLQEKPFRRFTDLCQVKY